MKSRSLDLMGEMTSPSLEGFLVRFQAAAQVLSRDRPRRRFGLRAGVAMVIFRIHRGLREDRARVGALQNQSRALVLAPHQMNCPSPHEMNKADRVAEVKYCRPGCELAYAAPQSLKE